MPEHTDLPQAPAPHLPASYVAPEAKPHRELTVRAVCVAVVVAGLMGAAEPVVVLRIGYGPNMSVVSAFLGFIAISLLGPVTGVRGTRWENNLLHTAGTAARSRVGFMAVVPPGPHQVNTPPRPHPLPPRPALCSPLPPPPA